MEQAQPSEPVSVRLRRALGKDYEIMGELGRGGFAVVYSVRDTRLNRYLAVKVMREEFVMSPETVERFQREAQIAAKLQHPNILSVTFAGEGHGLVYYAMPRVKGYALKDLLKKEEEISVD
ncbi:MAG: protein kinase, partial [Gemmatimonadales bacterium]